MSKLNLNFKCNLNLKSSHALITKYLNNAMEGKFRDSRKIREPEKERNSQSKNENPKQTQPTYDAWPRI